MHVVVTGGCGFIGSHFIRHLFRHYPDVRVTNIDVMTYAAHPETAGQLARVSPHRYHWVKEDIASTRVEAILSREPVDAIVNFAAESHVDRSILDPVSFIHTNVAGVQNLISMAKRNGNIRFIQVSTDEVYGSLSTEADSFTEASPLDSNSPYAASKAAADLLVLASFRTHRQNVVITRASNNFGPYQFPEKLIPLTIANAIENQPIPVYGDGAQVRDWLFVEDHCAAIAEVMESGRPGEVYNISAGVERKNLDVVKALLDLLGRPHSLITHVADRPGHDRRYSLNSSKIRSELEWLPKVSFLDGLRCTVDWYLTNPTWWKRARDKNFFDYYRANYESKFEPEEIP